MNWNGQAVSEKGYLTELLTAKAGAFLDQQCGDDAELRFASISVQSISGRWWFIGR